MESPVRKQDLQTAPEHDDQDGKEDHNSDKEECDVGEIWRDECGDDDECESNGSVGISEVQVRKSEEDVREVKAVLTAEAEALRWLQAVTGKTIENDNVRDALQDGVLLCELINILHPGCVWKINRRASPIAGLDNLGAFLRGCASLGLEVSQLFDPGDLQDPTTRHTLTSSEANRRVKNVLVTIYWLGRAASELPEYHGAPLNRKAFATLLAQSEETDETDSVLGSSWELEQSDTPSPHSCPQSHSDSLRPHDRVCCSLDKLEIIGGEVESPARKMPDIQKDDMATRRTSAMADQPRPAAPFNQFLPGQHNLTTGVLPGQPTVSQSNTGSQNHLTSPLVVSMSEVQQPAQLPIQQGKVDRFQVTEQKIQPRDFNWDSEDEERLGEPDVEKDDLAARRGWQGNRAPAVPHNRFLPARSDSRDVLRWENMVQSAQRLRDQAMLQIGHRQVKEKETSVSPGEQGPSLFIGAYRGRKHDPAVLPDTDRDDLARRRVGQSLPGRPQQVQAALCGPVSTSDLHTWQRLQIVCEGDREKVQSSDAVSTTELAPTPPRPASASALQPSSPFRVPARPQYMIPGGMTEGDLLRWQKLRIAGDDKEEDEEDVGRKEDQVVVAGDAPPLASNAEQTSHHGIPSVKAVCTESQTNDMVTRRLMRPYVVSTKQSQPFLPSHCAEEDQQRWQVISAALRRREQEHEEKREAAKGNDGDMSTSLIGLESEPGRLPGLSTYRRRESASAAEVESWQEDFARWKSRRQRASRELWKRKEEREMAEQAHASVGSRLLGTKTYREILEEKQRREQVLQNAYRQARNAGDAAAVLARYREQFLQDFAGERYELPEFLQQDLSLELEGLGLRSTQAPGLLRQLSEPPISSTTPLLNAFSASSGFGNFSAGTRMAVSAQTCTLSQMTETAVSSLIPVPVNTETPSVSTTPTTSQAPLNKINTSTSSVVSANVTNASSPTPPLNTSGSTLHSTGVKNPSNPPFQSFSLDHDSQLVSPALHLFPLPADSPPSPAPLSPSRTRLVPIVVPRPYKSQSSKLHSLLNFTILDADIDKNGTSCGRPGVLSDEKRTDFSPVMEEKKTTVGMDELALGNRHWGWDPDKQRRRLEHWQKQQQKHLEKQFERQQERLQKHWEQVQLGVEIQEQKHREEEIEILAKTAMPSIRRVGEGSAMPSSASSLSENNSHLRILEEEPEEQCNYLKTDFDLVEGTGRRNGEPSVQTEDCDLDLEGSRVEGRPESRLAEKSSALRQGPAVQTGRMLIGRQLCATCAQPVVKGHAMVIKALGLCFHVNCFKCDVCGQPLAPCNEGTDVRLQDGSLRCKTCDVDSNIEVARTSTV